MMKHKPHIVMIDHEDSFSETIAAELTALGANLEVFFLSHGSAEAPGALFNALAICDGLVLSPGPGHPQDYPHSRLQKFLFETRPELPVFGICLGLQVLLDWAGYKILPLSSAVCAVHGRTEILSNLHVLPKPFDAIDPQTYAVFYNSLGLVRHTVATLATKDHLQEVQNESEWNFVWSPKFPYCVNLAVHRAFPHFGVQFHPESFATPDGLKFFQAFLQQCESQGA